MTSNAVESASARVPERANTLTEARVATGSPVRGSSTWPIGREPWRSVCSDWALVLNEPPASTRLRWLCMTPLGKPVVPEV